MKITPIHTKTISSPIGELIITKGITPSGKEVTEFKELLNKKLSVRATIIKGGGSILEYFNEGKVTRKFINKA